MNRVYRNDGGGNFSSVWTSSEIEETWSAAWGDYDNDGDLDILVGNANQPNRVYKNDGGNSFNLAWTSSENEDTRSIAWGDYDNDGDMDILAGNNNQSNRIYENRVLSLSGNRLPNNSLFISFISNMGETPAGSGQYRFKYRIHDKESDYSKISKIQYSINNRKWKDAFISWSDCDLVNITTSSQGQDHYLDWDSSLISEDLITGQNIRLRFFMSSHFGKNTADPLVTPSAGPIQYGSFIYQMAVPIRIINGFPQCKITSPVSTTEPYDRISGQVHIYGYAYDDDFDRYILNYGAGTNPAAWLSFYSNTAKIPPFEELGVWDTSSLTNGVYSLRVIARDLSGRIRDSWTNANNRIRVELVNVAPQSSIINFIYPTNNQQNVALNSPVIIHFSDKINPDTLNPDSVKVYNGEDFLKGYIDGSIVYNNFSQCIIFQPNVNLSSWEDYIIIVNSEIQNIYGVTMGKEYAFKFKTTSYFPDKVSSVYPPPTQPDVGLKPDVKVYYSDVTLAGAGFTNGIEIMSIIQTNPAPVCDFANYSSASNMARYTNVTQLTDKMLYIVTLKPQVLDKGYYTWYFVTEDIVDPYVISTSPGSGSEIPLAGTVSAVFNKAMNGNSFTTNSFYIVNLADTNIRIKGNIEYLLNEKKVVFTPDEELILNNNYRARLTAEIKDFGGKPLTNIYEWNFHVAGYLGFPIKVSPDNKEEFVNINASIYAEFAIAMNPDSINDTTFKLYKGSDIVGAQLSYNAAKTQAILTPQSALEPETEYKVFISKNVITIDKQTMVDDYTWKFKTSPVVGKDGSPNISNGVIELNIPPNALKESVSIQIKKLEASQIPVEDDSDLTIVNNYVYQLGPDGLKLKKPVTITLKYSDKDIAGLDEAKLTLYKYKDGKWQRIGGTIDKENNTITAVIDEFTIVALVEDKNTYTGDIDKLIVECQPRVFKPSEWEQTAISFELPKPVKYTIKIYNVAGRMVNVVAEDIDGQPGQNVIFWDGKDLGGSVVPNRIYIIVILIDDGGKIIKKTKTVVVLEK